MGFSPWVGVTLAALQVSLNTYLIFVLCITPAAQQEEEGGHDVTGVEETQKMSPRAIQKLS